MADNSKKTIKIEALSEVEVAPAPTEKVKRLFCFSDIHANMPALMAVYNHALLDRHMNEDKGDRVIIPGDLINYGGTPGAVIDFIRSAFKSPTILMGNHEGYAHAVLKKNEVENLDGITEETMAHGDVLAGIERTLELLTPEQTKFVRNNTKMSALINENFLVSHTVPESLEEYVFPNTDVSGLLESRPDINFIMGHSHISSVFIKPKKGPVWPYNPDAEWDKQFGDDWRTSDNLIKVKVDFEDITNFLVVVPAIGKPRADDCRKAGYAIIDFVEECIILFRVPYDYERAINDIIANGMPEIFAEHIRNAR